MKSLSDLSEDLVCKCGGSRLIMNPLVSTSRGTRWGEIISVSDLYEI